eukprot:Hpha_TRINITY_DN1233_c0_g1::TRINITY_DN1233_c0_g1_i1::g.44836::m.44836
MMLFRRAAIRSVLPTGLRPVSSWPPRLARPRRYAADGAKPEPGPEAGAPPEPPPQQTLSKAEIEARQAVSRAQAEEVRWMRSLLPPEEQWYADAIFKDGRRATLKEIMESDPYAREQMIDNTIAKRGHPLRFGIQAALFRRIELLKQKEEKAGEYDRPMPDGMSQLQMQVLQKLREEHEK